MTGSRLVAGGDQWRRILPHDLSLRRRGPRANTGSIGHFEIAARVGLVASDELACASQRCEHVLDRHALTIVGVDEARLDPSISTDHERGWDGKHPGGIALVIRDIPPSR